MDLTIPPILTYIASWAGTIGIIWFLFEKTEETLTPKAKKAISNWIKNLDTKELDEGWPAQFAVVFDNVFGTRHLSWRCFYRSGVASSFSALILFLIWKTSNPSMYNIYAEEGQFIKSAISAIIMFIFLNLIPDYFSLLESRYIIRLMSLKQSAILILGYLVIDFVASF